MASKLAEMLGLSKIDQESFEKTTGRIQSVSDFLVSFVKATEKLDLVKSLAESTPWWLQAIGESVAEAAPPIKFLASLISKLSEVRDPNRLAYLAFTMAYQRSLEKALLTVGSPSSPLNRNFEWKPTRDIYLPHEEMSFETYSLKDPLNHHFINQANELLFQGMQATGYSESEIRRIQNEVQIRFPGCLKSLISHPSTREKFISLSESLHYDSNQEERVRIAWLDHFEYQRYLFEEQRVFGEEPFSLSDIYTETECGVLKCEELWDNIQSETCKGSSAHDLSSLTRRKIDPFNESCGGRHNLLSCVLELIGNNLFRDAIVIQGSAGSGKSVFTIRLAMELLRNGLKPIRIRFRDIPLRSMNIEDALPEAVRFWDMDQRLDDKPAARPDELFLKDMNLFDHTVKFGKAKICPYVLILDGWDEVSISAQKGFAGRISEILMQVRDRFLKRGNRSLVRVILTGRPSTDVSESSFLTKQTRLLTIRPLKPVMLQSFIENLAVRLVDKNELERANPKRFTSILEKYTKDFESSSENTPLEEKRAGTMEVLGLPLLTHLAVRLMVRWPDSDLSPLIANPTTLYRQLTNLTCEKGGRYGKDAFEPNFPGQVLRRLLHETASAMTVFGRDSIPYDELDIRLSQINENLFKRVQQVTMSHPVTSLMINYFFKGGRTELGAEFLHKSFREYLFAESIIETIKEYGRSAPEMLTEQSTEQYGVDFDVSDPRYSFSRRLSYLLGPQWLTKEVCLFIEGLICWELARSHKGKTKNELGDTSESLSISGWKKVANGLADIWNWWGEGVHLRSQPKFLGKKISDWSQPFVNEIVHWAMPQDLQKDEIPTAPRITSIDGHLGDGIFRLVTLVHHYLAVIPGDNSKWEDFDKPAKDAPDVRRYQTIAKKNGKWFVRFAPSGHNRSYFRNYVARINATGWHPGVVFPGGLFMSSIDFSGCELYAIGFTFNQLQGANFSRTVISGSYLSNLDLSNADFRGANIFGTSILKCKMDGVLIEGMNIHSCNIDKKRDYFVNKIKHSPVS